MSLSAGVLRRLMKELGDMQRTPPEGIRIRTSEDNMLDLVGIIEGPEGTPYAGGYFRVHFNFTDEFPAAPPKCRFITKIFHPNVGPQGEICVSTLKKDWKSSYGVGHILVTIKCLLIYPNPESALDEEAGKLLLENYESYCDRARLITSVHATPKVKPPEFQTSSAPAESPVSSAMPAAPTSLPPPPKSASPAAQPNPLKPVSKDHERERHVSPAPLSTADANVRSPLKSPASGMESLGVANGAIPGGNKAVKRAATGGASSGAEKRKKALKRL